MSLLTTAEVIAAGADGGLDAVTLQTIIDREEAELVRRFGANYPGPLTERAKGGALNLYLKRPISAVTSITEYAYPGDTAPATLVAADYEVWGEEGRIRRVDARWGYLASVVYTPTDDSGLRRLVLLELVRLNTAQDTGGSVSGLTFSIAGSGGAPTFAAQRGVQYARLGWLSR